MRYGSIFCIMMFQELVNKLPGDSIKCKYTQERDRQYFI